MAVVVSVKTKGLHTVARHPPLRWCAARTLELTQTMLCNLFLELAIVTNRAETGGLFELYQS